MGGLARFQGRSLVVLGTEKGHDTESRLKHNFGMARPEGYRKARRLMLQNLWFAVLYNAFAVPLAVAGLATPLVAAAAMSGSSLIVTINALRAGRATMVRQGGAA